MLQFLFSPTKQFQYPSSKLLSSGKIYVYYKDTQNLAELFNTEGEFQQNPIILDANGRASVKANDEYEYRLEVFTPDDELLYTCNAFYTDGSGEGDTFIVRHDGTLSGNGTSEHKLGVITVPLAVDGTMTAYSEIISDKETLVLGVEEQWFNTALNSATSSLLPRSEFSSCCIGVKGSISAKADWSALNAFYTKPEVNDLLTNKVSTGDFAIYTQAIDNALTSLSNGVNEVRNSAAWNLTNKLDSSSFADVSGLFLTAHQDISNKLDTSSFADVSGTFLTAHQDISNKLDVTAFSDVSGYFLQADDITGKQDKLTFNYTTANEISGINNSAIYAPGGEATGCPWISGAKFIEDTQLLTANMIIQTLSSFTVSGDKNHCIAVKGGKYQFPNQWQLASAIDETQWFAKASALSSYTPLSAYTPTIGDLYTSASWMMANKLDASAATGGQVETAYLPLSSLGDSVGSGNLNVGERCYVFGTDNEVRGINDFVAGSANTANADRTTVIFGECNSGNKNVLILGSGNVGLANSLVLGESCSSHGNSLSLGESAYSNWYSVAVGSSVYANDYSLAVGRDTTANYMSMAVGNQNSANYHSLVVGSQNLAEGYSMIAGDSNSGYMSVIAGGTNADLSSCVVVGNSNGSCKCSLVIGDFNSGCNSGICVGGSNSGDLYSVTVGQDNKVGWKSMAIGNGLRLDRWENGIAVGKYNKTSAACFVVGNGDADDDRSDLFVIDNQGTVSANDVVIPGGITLATLYNAFTAYTANHP